jgi:hypothetical protein
MRAAGPKASIADRTSTLNGIGECNNSLPDDSRMTVKRVPICKPTKEWGANAVQIFCANG